MHLTARYGLTPRLAALDDGGNRISDLKNRSQRWLLCGWLKLASLVEPGQRGGRPAEPGSVK